MLRWLSRARGIAETAAASDLHVGDARFDDWEVVADFEDLPSAQAWRRHLVEVAGIEAVLTADWALDRFGRGDIALRVRREDASDAEDFLGGLEAEDS
jgi:hypothetical protein